MHVHPEIKKASERYGIPFICTDVPPKQGEHQWLEIWMYLDAVAPSCVYFFEATSGACDWEFGPSWTLPERLLHELVHVICYHPDQSLNQHELWLLMPFERELARQLFASEPLILDRVIQFQLDTKVHWEGKKTLREFNGLEESLPIWSEALERAKEFGLLDSEGRVTWKSLVHALK